MNRRACLLIVLVILFSACGGSRKASILSPLVVDETAPSSSDPAAEQTASPDPLSMSVEDQIDWIFDELGVALLIETGERSVLELYEVMVQILPSDTQEARLRAADSLPTIMEDDARLILAKDHFIQHADHQRLASVIAFMGSETGGKWLGAADTGLLSSDIEEAEVLGWLSDFYGALEDEPTLQERIDLVEEIEAASGQSRRSLEFTLEMGDGILDSFMKTLPEIARPHPEHVQMMRLTMQATMTQPAFQQALRDSSLFSSRDLDLDELRAVISYHEHGPGEWFLDVLDGAKRTVGRELIQRLVANLTEALESAPIEPEI